MQLPAVQDDFIATFLCNHFGYIPALGLLALQLLLVWGIARLSNELLHNDNRYSSALERQIGYSGSLFCYGFAGLLIAHWLISWSNVLGLLPVMGQPMAILSAGGSNLMLFVVPCLLLSFCFSWIKEQ
jgi:cell division protein FtsW (lipid II flippase)